MGISAAIGIVGAGINLYKGMKAEKRAKQQGDRAYALSEKQVKIEEERFDLWKQYWLPSEKKDISMRDRLRPSYEKASKTAYDAISEDRDWYTEHVRPVMKERIEQAGPDYEGAIAEADAASASAENRAIGMDERKRASMGLDPSDHTQFSREMAGSRAALKNRAVRDERAESFNRMGAVSSQPQVANPQNMAPMPASGAQMSRPNFGSAARTTGNLSGQSWNMAGDYAKAAGQSAMSVGKAIGGGGSQSYGDPFQSNSYKGFAEGGLVKENYAHGGLVEGPGSGVSDSVPASVDGKPGAAALSSGEFVLTAEEVEGIVRTWMSTNKSGLSRSIV